MNSPLQLLTKPNTIVITGGAGYIGSHMVRMAQDQGYQTVVVDNLSTGNIDAVHDDAVLLIGDIGDKNFMGKVFREFDTKCVVHFAAVSSVEESIFYPAKYWQNNFGQTLNLLEAMREYGVNQFIFSSTAAVYGSLQRTPFNEYDSKLPISPYGQSKLAVEYLLSDYDRTYGMRYTTFRYFNAAGAHPDGSLGERHKPETHLIPLILEVAAGRRAAINRFGTDFDTRDGSCIRDYVHVQDLAAAHLLALQRLNSGEASATYNLGLDVGHSVTEMIQAARLVTQHDIPICDYPRRAGDPAVLIANSALARIELGWQPQYIDIHNIIAHALLWEQKSQRLQRTSTKRYGNASNNYEYVL